MPPEAERALGRAATPFVRCEGLYKIYRSAGIEVVALQGLDLEVARGEMLAVVGRSGSGKSTLIHLLGGLDAPTAGRVVVAGQDVAAMGPAERRDFLRWRVAFIWQAPSRNLIGGWTAAQNVAASLLLAGLSSARARERGLSLLGEVGVAGVAGDPVLHLSGGQQQRLALAIALAGDADLLLADEPTAELDEASALEAVEVLRRLQRERRLTVVVVTHDRRVADRADRTVHIEDGKVAQEEVQLDQYRVLDRQGRLVVPREYRERLGRRVRLEPSGDDLVVRRAD